MTTRGEGVRRCSARIAKARSKLRIWISMQTNPARMPTTTVHLTELCARHDGHVHRPRLAVWCGGVVFGSCSPSLAGTTRRDRAWAGRAQLLNWVGLIAPDRLERVLQISDVDELNRAKVTQNTRPMMQLIASITRCQRWDCWVTITRAK